MHFSIKSCGFRIRRYDMCFYNNFLIMHNDLNVFISWVFRGREGKSKY